MEERDHARVHREVRITKGELPPTVPKNPAQEQLAVYTRQRSTKDELERQTDRSDRITDPEDRERDRRVQ